MIVVTVDVFHILLLQDLQTSLQHFVKKLSLHNVGTEFTIFSINDVLGWSREIYAFVLM